jgi:hypothetical protein
VDGAQKAFETRRIYANLFGLNMARGRSCRMISTREVEDGNAWVSETRVRVEHWASRQSQVSRRDQAWSY